MSKSMVIVHAAGTVKLTVSDAEYASIDWGSSHDDTFAVTTADGSFYRFDWLQVNYVQASPGTLPSPGTYPCWQVHTGHVDVVVDNPTKAAIQALIASGDDVLVEFQTMQGQDVRFMARNTEYISLRPASVAIPEP